MKYQRLLLLCPFVFSLSGCSNNTNYQPKELDPNVTYSNVYLIMGQSNASGVSLHSFLKESNPELYQLYTEGNQKVLTSYDTYYHTNYNFQPTRFGLADEDEFFGPEIGIAEVLKEKEETSYVIKASLSGSCLQTQWVDKHGNKYRLYNRFLKFITGQLRTLESKGLNPRVKGVFWMQGESDSIGYQDDYKEAEEYFYKYLRADLNNWIYDHFNFVDAYISTKTEWWVYADDVNAAKEQLSTEYENCYCIKTNGEDENALNLNLKYMSGEDPEDYAHYDSKSMILLGKEAAKFLVL